jgi:pimeloyl-ACP methyl ester carboxylesterase
MFAAVLAVSGSAAPAASVAPTSTSRHCRAGSTPATIAGKHVCLRPGARCTTRLDRAYHRYRFHCHSGRLVRFPPAPRPAQPPPLPEPPPPAGQLVDVGGYRLHLECVGTGAPTVLLEPGNTASRHGVRKIQYALGTETRVCSYDRPGTVAPIAGSSDARPPTVPPTSETFVRELRTVLTNGHAPGPYVLVGASFGGLLISAYTAHHPADVAGLVFIDAVGPASIEATLRAIIEPWEPGADLDLIRGVNFESRPVVILTTTLPAEAADIQRRSTNALVAAAPQYSHFVSLDAPGLVYETIRVAVAAVRAGRALPTCAQTPLPQIGARCMTP